MAFAWALALLVCLLPSAIGWIHDEVHGIAKFSDQRDLCRDNGLVEYPSHYSRPMVKHLSNIDGISSYDRMNTEE